MDIRRKRLCCDAIIGAVALTLVSWPSFAQNNLAQNFNGNSVMKLPHASVVTALAWSPDGRYLATRDQRDHALSAWDTNTGSRLFKSPELAGSRKGLAYTRNGKFIISSGDDPAGSIAFKVWDSQTGALLKDVLGPEPTVKNNTAEYLFPLPDNRRVAVLHIGGLSISLYDVETWSFVSTIHIGGQGRLNAAAMSPTESILAIAAGGSVHLWDLSRGVDKGSFIAEPRKLRSVKGLAFSPDGKSIASSSSVNPGEGDMQIRLWDAESFKLLGAYHTNPDVEAITMDEHSLIAVQNANQDVRLWSTARFDEGKPMRTSVSPIFALALSPDGRRLAIGGSGSVEVIPIHD